MATRRYEQRQRAEAAEQTRRRILDAVIERLRKAPAEPVSIDRIAEMAGVARSTVYAIFGSRAGLFDAVAADVLEREDYERLLEAKHEPDAREHMRVGFRTGTEMLAADRDIVRALFSMAQLDEGAVGDAVRKREENRARRNGAPGRAARRAGPPPARRRASRRPSTSSGSSRASRASTCSTPAGASRPRRPRTCCPPRPNERC